ncbi:MAG: 4-(cytidine 5'-diphospho)-2-C-methyl-D-erythritol kinase [Clostridia bacterium]|nr:4-(cytidine 5'-diphospho)-2-C-methyl-D-erythritol kinase [Clostridia bacterium]
MNNTVTLSAYAKINLFLDITACRADGYHSLNSVMQQISLADTLTVTLGGRGDGIALTTDSGTLACDEHNLIWRAARAFFAALGESRDVAVHLTKQIPMQAGLGGGSADCAAALHALNALCGKPFTTEQLSVMGAELGADVPFCVLGGTARAEGIGERLTPLPPMPDCTVVVAMGAETMPTPAAFRALDVLHDRFASRSPKQAAYDALCTAMDDLPTLARGMYNIFEEAVFPALPALPDRLQILLEAGALGARMSGSGAAVFGLFVSAADAARAAEALRRQGADVWLASPIR